MKKNKPIVFVGLMGAGKTRIGREVAKRLEMMFVDSDSEIERAAGYSVSEIFERYGEAAFRSGEQKVIKRLLSDEPLVIATGGGAFMNDDTRSLILEKSVSIWLKADLKTLVERTSRTNHRPLLQQGNPEEILRGLIQKRDPVYAQAHIHVGTGEDNPVKMAKKVISDVENYLNNN